MMQRRAFVAGMAAVMTTPPVGDAQQSVKPWRIGFLSQATPQATLPGATAFRGGMKELGYVEGQRYFLELRYADGRSERLGSLAADLAALPVDIIVAPSTPSSLAAMQAT